MKLFISVCLFTFLFFSFHSGFAQQEIEISGVKYLLHAVEKGETVYSLCQKYKITPTAIKEANPDIKAVLKTGSKIKIPINLKVSEQKPDQQVAKSVVSEPEYFYHKVNKKQTIFSISKQYGISPDELISYNPEISKGLVAGKVLKIPVQLEKNKNAISERVETTNGGSQDGFIMHLVVADETIYSLGLKYGVTREELKMYNPNLEDGLKIGTKLRIPIKENLSKRTEVQRSDLPEVFTPTNVVISKNCIPLADQNSKKYNIGFILPFYLRENALDSLPGLNNEVLVSKIDFNQSISQLPVIVSDSTVIFAGANIDQRAESFLEFYEGALLAIDSLQQKGMQIELYVFDATNQEKINTLINMDVFRDLDLIIGPVYPELQESVASFAAKNRIPMVSPLASTGNFEENNPWYFKVNPTREYQIEQTANYIADEFMNKNFILLPMIGNSNSTEAKLAELAKTKLLAARELAKISDNLYHEYSFQTQGVNNIHTLLDKNGENVFIISTDNEAQVSVAVTNLNALAENYEVVLIGTSNLIKLKSIQTENYHHVRLRYLSPYFIDYKKPFVRRFISRYRETFSDEPSQFSYQGFDVTYYFLSALKLYGKDFRSCLPQYQMDLTQMKFNFRRVTPMGGFMNNGLLVNAYERNYDILNYGNFESK